MNNLDKHKVMVWSVREKKTSRRVLFLTIGFWITAKAFYNDLKQELDYNLEDFDLRTVKCHHDHFMPQVTAETPVISLLDYVNEDFGDLKEQK